MTRYQGFFIVCMTVLFTLSGCGNKDRYPLENSFRTITVGQSSSTEVMNRLPEQGMLHTTNSISVLNELGWSTEAGIVTFNEKDSRVLRKIYLQQVSNINAEQFFLHIQFQAPEELLNEPYETEMRKNLALLEYAHDALVQDIRPFTSDTETESIMGLARWALSRGIIHFSQQPRDAHTLVEQDGFYFDHSTMNDSRMKLKQNSDNIFSIAIRTHARVDPFVGW